MRPGESFVGQPIRSLQTMLRVLAEHDPQYQSVIPDGIYGPDTMAAVTLFQRQRGLPPTGITDQATWEAIVNAHDHARIQVHEAEPVWVVLNPNQVIRRGERHPHVFLAQGMLAVLADLYESIGMPSHSGILDDQTADSISSFQMQSALPMTGHLDKATWKHLSLHYPLASNLSISRDKLGD